jgi:hypothetical protein
MAEEKMLSESGRFTPASPMKEKKSPGLATFPQTGKQSSNPPKTPDRNLAPIKPNMKSKAKRQSSLPGCSFGEYREEATTPVPLPGINPRKCKFLNPSIRKSRPLTTNCGNRRPAIMQYP